MLSLRSHRRALRVALVAAVLVVGAFTALRVVPPADGHHTAPVDTRAIARLATPLVPDVPGNQPIELSFSRPMDRASVRAALSVVPAHDVQLAWSAGDTRLSIAPSPAWAPATVYTISVGSAARTAAGGVMTGPVRAVFLTADAPTASIAAVAMSGKRASPTAGFRISFSRPVNLSSLQSALSITPQAVGQLTTGLDRGSPTVVTWVPTVPLSADATYVVTFGAPVSSSDGMTVAPAPRLVVRTIAGPEVVRTRPANHAQSVPAGATVSIRFGRSMDRASTQAAFRLVLEPADSGVSGHYSWAENDTVLVFTPARALAAGHVYTLILAGSATSQDGAPVALPGAGPELRASFRVAAPALAAVKSAPAPAGPAARPSTAPAPRSTEAPRSTAAPSATPTRAPSAQASAGAPWLNVERYALQLLNCTRTGGWVQSDGTCDGYGSGRYSTYVAPLTLSAGISSAVSRPYAKYQAVRNACSHFLQGTPGDRLAAAGYTSYRWGENIGCQTASPSQAVVNSLLFFQSEKSYNGGHWANLKNAQYSTVGIGVWDSNGYVLVVFDFYHP